MRLLSDPWGAISRGGASRIPSTSADGPLPVSRPRRSLQLASRTFIERSLCRAPWPSARRTILKKMESVVAAVNKAVPRHPHSRVSRPFPFKISPLPFRPPASAQGREADTRRAPLVTGNGSRRCPPTFTAQRAGLLFTVVETTALSTSHGRKLGPSAGPFATKPAKAPPRPGDMSSSWITCRSASEWAKADLAVTLFEVFYDFWRLRAWLRAIRWYAAGLRQSTTSQTHLLDSVAEITQPVSVRGLRPFLAMAFLTGDKNPIPPPGGPTRTQRITSTLSLSLVAGLTHFTEHQHTEATIRASRSRKHLAWKAVPDQSLSFLEATSVKDGTRRDYRERAAEFVMWCEIRRVCFDGPKSLDEALLLWCDEMFFKGLSPEEGSKLVASLKFSCRSTAGSGTSRSRECTGRWRAGVARLPSTSGSRCRWCACVQSSAPSS